MRMEEGTYLQRTGKVDVRLDREAVVPLLAQLVLSRHFHAHRVAHQSASIKPDS